MMKNSIETGSVSFHVGVGKVDITPNEPVVIAGSPAPDTTTGVDIPLFARVMVIDEGQTRVAIVTLDTLKYPTELAETTMSAIERETGIPADKIAIVSSHTHSGPLYTYYDGSLACSIVEAVKLAIEDIEPCTVGTAKTEVSGVSYNRRVLAYGEAWNTWLLRPRQAKALFPACGPVDEELQTMAVMRVDGTYKAVLWNFTCHASAVGSNGGNRISADYPGAAETYISRALGYDATALFLPGACGDIVPCVNVDQMGQALGAGILKCLQSLEGIAKPTIAFKMKIIDLPARENPYFAEEEIAVKWPSALESFRESFNTTIASAQPTYKTYICAIGIGKDYAVVTNPDELFCRIGKYIKDRSPFQYTVVAEQTNGALGYIPAEQDFPLKGYEVWYGEHSICAASAGTMIQDVSIELLRALKNVDVESGADDF